VEGLRIGVLGRCETQFGIALQRPGAAALDPTLYESIRKLKSEVDVVVLSVHGAAEMVPWPSPQWQDLLRSFVDCGADIVHGHHSHIPQGYEVYQGKIIFYGLGNFLVNPADWLTHNTPDILVADRELNTKLGHVR
jgi:poly-gamma-glutamate synthesis protein (capsule biosynthesis protein)